MKAEKYYSGPLPTRDDGSPLTIAEAAWDFYMTPGKIGGSCERVRNYLPIQDTLHLAEALGRPIRVEEFKILVQPDGVVTTCSVTGKEFQPIRWVPVTRWLCERLKGKSLLEIEEEGSLRYQGHFFVAKGRVFAYSGTPFRFAKGFNDRWNEGYPLLRAFHLNGNRWGLARRVADEIVACHNQRREEIVRMDDEISRQIGNWRPGRGRGNNSRATTQGKGPKKSKKGKKVPAGNGGGLALEDFGD